MQSHGEPNQAAPTIDAYGVINVTIPAAAAEQLSGEVHAGADPCNRYIAAAQAALRAANPVGPPPDQTQQIKWVNCLRANGYPTFPYPQANQTNFNGTGIDPTSAAFLKGKANQTCGKQVGAPSWWTNGTGPPGDVVVSATFTWLLLYKKYDNAQIGETVKKFVNFGLTDGQKFAAELGYIPLPKEVVEKDLEALKSVE